MTITRSQMYRQLRRSGGITNAVPRKGYFFLYLYYKEHMNMQ